MALALDAQPVAPGRCLVVKTGDLDDVPPGCLELAEVALLVRLAALRDKLDRPGRRRFGFLARPAMRGPLERETMRAGEEADEVGRGVDGPAVDQLHA